MKKHLLILASIGLMLICGAKGQQIAIPQQYIQRPAMYNPALSGSQLNGTPEHGRNSLFLGSQIRRTSFGRGLSTTNFLAFLSRPTALFLKNNSSQNSSKKAYNRFGIGGYLIQDKENIDQRVDALIGISVQLWDSPTNNPKPQKPIKNLSIGASTGLMYQFVAPDKRSYFDPGDPAVSRVPGLNFDLRMGAGFTYLSQKLRFSLSGAFLQMPYLTQSPENILNNQSIFLYQPHVLADARLLLDLGKGVDAGPYVVYRRPLGPKLHMVAANFEAGVKLTYRKPMDSLIVDPKNHYEVFKKQHPMWLMMGYRFPNAAFNGAFGIKIWEKSKIISSKYMLSAQEKLKLKEQKKRIPEQTFYHSLDLSFGFEFPTNEAIRFGPSVDLSLAWNFGGSGRNPLIFTDTIRIKPPFWYSDNLLMSYVMSEWIYFDKSVVRDSSVGYDLWDLKMTSDKSMDKVYLRFEYIDDFKNYDVESIGDVKMLCEFLAGQMTNDALNQSSLAREVSEEYKNDKLTALESITLEGRLRIDSLWARENSDWVYGERDGIIKGRKHQYTLDGKPETLILTEGDSLTYGDIAALKLLSIKEHLLASLNKNQHNGIQTIQPEDIEVELETGFVFFKTYQKNQLSFSFKRDNPEIQVPSIEEPSPQPIMEQSESSEVETESIEEAPQEPIEETHSKDINLRSRSNKRNKKGPKIPEYNQGRTKKTKMPKIKTPRKKGGAQPLKF